MRKEERWRKGGKDGRERERERWERPNHEISINQVFYLLVRTDGPEEA